MLSIREQARHEIAELVERYRRLDAKSLRAYNEANTCKDFILPLFRALGWDVYDSAEVSAERKVSRGRVDYAFRLGGIPRFFLEAKRFAADLEDPKWARQVINYAWIKDVTWAVLTDFEGLKVFNAEWKEANPLRNIFIDLTYDQYLDEFDRLWLLSREAIAEGRIDQEALRVGKKLKKHPIGEQLFGELVRWREKLHYYLRRYNPDFSDDQIDEAVQRILDRLTFIRTCEDRGIEPPTLRPLLREWRDGGRRRDLVKLLRGVFRDFDEGYDAQLFAPHFCEGLESEPAPYEEIIEGLYATLDGIIEYDFNAIDVDVLGGIYEQYLGYVAKVAEQRERRGLMERLKRPKEERPPEIEIIERKGWRKKHGIYYTPQFVVRYIVANTLGRLLEERSYNEVKQLKVLDPACGSGSFLIEAFDVLDKYHRGVRGDHAEFDFFRRAEILTSNIYGVDLDAQAVEIARLNLLLKTLNQRAQLPDLVDSIRQGNSLISGTPEELQEYFGEDWEEKRPFNWEEEFPQIMASGGFDVVIGNPPYFTMLNLPAHDQRYFEAAYPEIFAGQNDILYYFIVRGLRLLKDSGLLGFIVSRYFLESVHAKKFRQFILDHAAIKAIVDFQNVQLFEGVNVLTAIVILERQNVENLRRGNQVKVVKVNRWSGDYMQLMAHIQSHLGESYVDEFIQVFPISQSSMTADPWSLSPMSVELLKQKMAANSWALGSIFEIGQGMKTGLNEVFIVDSQTVKKYGLEPELLRRYVKTRDIKRYQLYYRDLYLLCLYKDTDIGQFPNAERYLRPFEAKLKERYQFKDGVCHWYSLSIPQNRELFEQDGEKIMTPSYSTSNKFAYDPGGESGQFFSLTDTYVLVPKSSCPVSAKYVLGLLNSKALEFFHKNTAKLKREGYYEYFTRPLSQLPIRRIDFDNPEEKKMHDDLVALVERMLELNRRLKGAVGREREELARKIKRTDREIDELVYKLYGITEERRIVEGA